MDVSCFSGAHTIYLNLIDTRGVDQTKFCSSLPSKFQPLLLQVKTSGFLES